MINKYTVLNRAEYFSIDEICYLLFKSTKKISVPIKITGNNQLIKTTDNIYL